MLSPFFLKSFWLHSIPLTQRGESREWGYTLEFAPFAGSTHYSWHPLLCVITVVTSVPWCTTDDALYQCFEGTFCFGKVVLIHVCSTVARINMTKLLAPDKPCCQYWPWSLSLLPPSGMNLTSSSCHSWPLGTPLNDGVGQLITRTRLHGDSSVQEVPP